MMTELLFFSCAINLQILFSAPFGRRFLKTSKRLTSYCALHYYMYQQYVFICFLLIIYLDVYHNISIQSLVCVQGQHECEYILLSCTAQVLAFLPLAGNTEIIYKTTLLYNFPLYIYEQSLPQRSLKPILVQRETAQQLAIFSSVCGLTEIKKQSMTYTNFNLRLLSQILIILHLSTTLTHI